MGKGYLTYRVITFVGSGPFTRMGVGTGVLYGRGGGREWPGVNGFRVAGGEAP